MRLIDADALIAEYDRVHVGEAGGARKLMEDAPTVDAVLREDIDKQFQRLLFRMQIWTFAVICLCAFLLICSIHNVLEMIG